MHIFALLLIPALIIGAMSALHSQYQLDDALIYARYIHNAIAGNGFAFNAGEIWGGVTSPLHSYLLFLFTTFSRDALISQRLLSCIFYVIATLAGSLLLLKLTSRALPAFLFTLFLSTSMYFYSIFGMESFLFVSLLALSVLTYEKEKDSEQPVLLAMCLSLLVLTRGEGIFLIGILLFVHLRQKRPMPDWRVWLIPFAFCCAHLGAHYILFGSVFAKTMEAKIAQGASGLWGGHLAFLKGVKIYTWYFGTKVSIPFILSVFLTCFGFIKAFKHEPIQVFFAFLCATTIFYLSLAIPFYHWYYAPFIYFAYFLMAFGVWQLSELFRDVPLALKPLRYALLSFAAFVIWQQGGIVLDFVQQRHKSPYKQIGHWLKEHTPQDATVASVEVGALGWYSERYIIDILGLTSPFNAKFIAKRDFKSWSKHYSPDYMLVHEPLWEQERDAKDFIAAGATPINNGLPKGFILLKINKKNA